MLSLLFTLNIGDFVEAAHRHGVSVLFYLTMNLTTPFLLGSWTHTQNLKGDMKLLMDTCFFSFISLGTIKKFTFTDFVLL